MRTTLLLLITWAVYAAELEQITLTDGRVLVGVYDEAAGVVNISGAGSAAIRVKPSQIKLREPYVAPPEAAAPIKPIPADGKPKESPVLSLEAARAQAKKLREKAAEIEFDAIVQWIQRDTATPVERPTLGVDPKKSEQEAHDLEMAKYKRHMKLKEILKESKIAETEEERMQIVYRVNEIIQKDTRDAALREKRK